MTPSARLQASAEILDHIRSKRASAEQVLKDWGRAHRFAGSKDRRAIADKVYQCLRSRERLAHFMGLDEGRALVLGSTFLLDNLSINDIDTLYDGVGYAPSPLSDDERAKLMAPREDAPVWLEVGLPEFVTTRLEAVYGEGWKDEAKALIGSRAPIDLRINGDREQIKQGLEMLGFAPQLTPFSLHGLRLPCEPAPNIRALPAFGQGIIEIQDEGSQICAFLAGAKPGSTVIDYCAGGGGKALAMLQTMQDKGRLVVSDIDRLRLNNIKPRLKRSGQEAEFREIGEDGSGMEDLKNRGDVVLVDAPCSGSGVWRRRPEAAQKLTLSEVEALHVLQVEILSHAAKLVKISGRLVYATCSVLPDENEDTLAAFEAAHPNFAPLPIEQALKGAHITPEGAKVLSALSDGSHRLRLSPNISQTDGFFIALYERKS